jgi:membrane dipeptidase
MVIDCSHSAYKTTMEAMQRSNVPVIFSHSNVMALADHGRNIRDDQIRACAEGGGVIGINGLSLFLGDKGRSKAETVARHVAYIADLVGHEHVGISLDFDPTLDNEDSSGDRNCISDVLEEDPEYWPPEAGYNRPIDFLPLNSLPRVCDELFQMGFTESELTGILGGNFRRVAEQVWK